MAVVGMNTGHAPDQCQRCGGNFRWSGDGETLCVDRSGREYDHLTDAARGADLWCPGCWRERETERRSDENHGLAEFGGPA